MATSLLVQVPDNYRPERAWIVNAVLGEFLGLSPEIRFEDRSDVRLSVATGEETPRALHLPDRLFQAPDAAWLTAGPLPVAVAWADPGGLPGTRATERIPVLMGELAEGGGLASRRGQDLTFHCDVLGTAFLYLTRYEEVVARDRDEHGRFPSGASFATRLGVQHLPVVDLQVAALRAGIEQQWPGLTRPPDDARVLLSHDVDLPFGGSGRPVRRAFSRAVGDVLRRRSSITAARTILAWAGGERFGGGADPCNSFAFLMSMSERCGLRSAFFFSAPDPRVDPYDATYRIEGLGVRRLLRQIVARGHEIGVHPSYGTPGRPDLLLAETRRVQRAAERAGATQSAWGGRQHYLRWNPASSWRDWEEAGLAYDSTLGWADTVGFRCGTCREYPVFALRERRSLKLRERPLIAMDVALTEYQRLEEDTILEQLTGAAALCRRVGGDFSLLWHNDGVATRAARAFYARALAAVVATR